MVIKFEGKEKVFLLECGNRELNCGHLAVGTFASATLEGRYGLPDQYLDYAQISVSQWNCP